MLQDDRIRLAVAEETTRWHRVAAVKAVREVHRILNDPEARDVDKLRAADCLLVRLNPIITGHVMRIEHTTNTASKIPRNRRWMR
ncbi:MAG TPA: hypothetical protein VLJ17_18315 [Xanthobacteraceae bacterium]|nr:hypothetical protein [Xanthobacteraceae bacterium]